MYILFIRHHTKSNLIYIDQITILSQGALQSVQRSTPSVHRPSIWIRKNSTVICAHVNKTSLFVGGALFFFY